MKKRAAAAKSKEHEEHTRKFQEFSKRVEAELHALPDDFTSVSRTATLTRYLIARQYDVDKAFKMMKDSLEWRAENSVASILDANIPDRSMATLIKERKAFYAGYDRTGHPVYLEYTAAGNWSDVTSKAGQDDVIKAHIQSMEFCARIVLPVASNRAKRSVFRTVNILDMRGLSMGMFSKDVLEIFSKVAEIDKNHYPETLHQCYIVNPPLAFRAAWALVRPMLDEKTRNKIKVLGSGMGMVTKLREFLGPDAYLPTAALIGTQNKSKIEELISAFEVVFEYIADRQRQIAHGVKMEGMVTSTSYAVLTIGPGLKLSAVDFRTVPAVDEDEPPLDESDADDVASVQGGYSAQASLPSPVSPKRQPSKTPSRGASRGEASGRRGSLDAFSSPGSPTGAQSQSRAAAGGSGGLRLSSTGRAVALLQQGADDNTDASSVNDVWFDAEEDLKEGSLDSMPEEGSFGHSGGQVEGGRAARTESELTQRDYFYTDRLNEWAQKAAKAEGENPTPPGKEAGLRSFIRRINTTSGTGAGGNDVARPLHSDLDSVEQLAVMVSEMQETGANGTPAVVGNGDAAGHANGHGHGESTTTANGEGTSSAAAEGTAKKQAPPVQHKGGGGWLCCFSGGDADAK